MRSIFFTGLFLIAISGRSARAQVPSFAGTITSESGKPINGVIVRLDNTEKKTATNEDGYFEISGLPPGQAYTHCTRAGGMRRRI